jgi:SPP1 family predicted phage head-tail adaptor
MSKAINAGKYNRRISIYSTEVVKDAAGFQSVVRTLVLQPYAAVKTTRGFTLIRNSTDFEKAYTNFTIRFPHVAINRDMEIDFNGKTYTIEYLNNVDEANVELEIEAKEVTH